MSDNTESMGIYVKERIKSHLQKISAFYQQVISDQGAMATIRQEIIDLKKSKGPKGFEEAKSKIRKMQDVHYNMFLLNQSISQYQVIIFELNTMAKAFGIEVDIPEDKQTQEYYKTITSTSPFLFELQDGQPAMVNTDMIDAVMGAMKGKIHNEDNLKKIYETL